MIEVWGLTYGYKRSEAILEDVNWSFPAGKVSGITGKSGSGKSTLLYLLGLLLSPWSGQIRVDGTDMASRSDRERSALRATNIGFVFQDAALDPSRTVLDNAIEASIYGGLPRRQAVARARQLLARFEVDLREDHKPGEVSGGQAQRVALCRALLLEPSIILADEPTGNLDHDTAGVVIRSLAEMAHKGGATVIIASHDPVLVRQCDEVLAL